MKKVLLGFAVIMLAVITVSCSKSNSPKDVATSFIQAMKNKNYEKAADCFYYEGTKDEIKADKAQVLAFMEKAGQSIEKDGGIKSYKINSVEEDGDTAIVKGEITYGNGDVKEDEIETKKVDGKWYIDLSK
ncbi:MAG: DUF4878 domain-containing protein [Muribaculaceae bacterium]|jgi:hypothetical protein|nr:DUF4878 domain-containing protein [Muribaculaceae bacterium]